MRLNWRAMDIFEFEFAAPVLNRSLSAKTKSSVVTHALSAFNDNLDRIYRLSAFPWMLLGLVPSRVDSVEGRMGKGCWR